MNFFAGLAMEQWLAIGSAALALASFGFNWAVVRRQTAMQFESLRADHDARLIDWADAAIEAIADAQRHCRDLKNGLLTSEQAAHAASALRTRMSALLDRGRLFFPNQPDAASDEDDASEAAYSGRSHPAIDALYRAYRVISDLGRASPLSPGEAVRAVVAQRRRFVSEVFRTIDPRRRQASLSALDYRRVPPQQERSGKPSP